MIARRAAAVMVMVLTAGAGWAQALDEEALFEAATKAVRDREFRQAVALFETLAEADIPDAQYNLAVLLREGRGRPQNHADALYWGALAQLADVRPAQAMVSELNDRLPLAAREAVVARLIKRLTAQADAGKITAPRKLARVYAELKPEPDPRLAYIWFSICHALGQTRCAEGRDRMAGEIAPEDLVQVQVDAGETFAGLPFADPEGAETAPDAGQGTEFK